MKKKLKKTSIYIDEKEYEIFKKVCKIKKTSSAKKVRDFIKEFLFNNVEVVAELKNKGEI